MTAYRDAVLEIVIRERDEALNRLTRIAHLCATHEPHYGDGTVNAIRTVLGPTQPNHQPATETGDRP